MTKDYEDDELNGSGRGKKRNQKMKPFLVYHYLLKHTDEHHTVKADDICSDMKEIYGIEAERRGIYRDIDEINKQVILRDKTTIPIENIYHISVYKNQD